MAILGYIGSHVMCVSILPGTPDIRSLQHGPQHLDIFDALTTAPKHAGRSSLPTLTNVVAHGGTLESLD